MPSTSTVIKTSSPSQFPKMASVQDSQPFHWRSFAGPDDRDLQIRGRTLFFAVVLFVTVLIFTLAFVYARWLCGSHQRREQSVTSHAPPQQARGLDPNMINALPITMVTRGETARGSECCICLGVFEDGEKVKVWPNCRHPYHSECVDRWLSAESSCPLCRTSLRVESDRNLHQVPVIVSQ